MKTTNTWRALGVLALASTSAACATVTRGNNTAWEVQTTPSGAHVSTSNGMFCDNTPCSLKMPRKSQFTATISKPGYKTTTVSVTNKVSTGGGVGMAGNVLLGGIIGAGVDVATGAMLDLTPNPAIVALEREEVATVPYTPSTPPASPTPTAAPAPVAGTPSGGGTDHASDEGQVESGIMAGNVTSTL